MVLRAFLKRVVLEIFHSVGWWNGNYRILHPILPVLGSGGIQLFKRTGPVADKLNLDFKTAKMLWIVYCSFTLLQIILPLAGMPLFDSVCHGLTTMLQEGLVLKMIVLELIQVI